MAEAGAGKANKQTKNSAMLNVELLKRSVTEWNEIREEHPEWPVDLSGAELNQANLIGANLQGADLTGAILRRTDLHKTNLCKANMTMAIIAFTTFADVDLSTVEGLDTVKHHGPSTIGIDTLYLSKGNIPEIFLRGCGVPDTFIEYVHSLTGKAFDYYSCFISHSTADKAFADRIHADLQAKGVRCWYAPHDMESGEHIDTQIDNAIRVHEKLLLIPP